MSIQIKRSRLTWFKILRRILALPFFLLFRWLFCVTVLLGFGRNTAEYVWTTTDWDL